VNRALVTYQKKEAASISIAAPISTANNSDRASQDRIPPMVLRPEPSRIGFTTIVSSNNRIRRIANDVRNPCGIIILSIKKKKP